MTRIARAADLPPDYPLLEFSQTETEKLQSVLNDESLVESIRKIATVLKKDRGLPAPSVAEALKHAKRLQKRSQGMLRELNDVGAAGLAAYFGWRFSPELVEKIIAVEPGLQTLNVLLTVAIVELPEHSKDGRSKRVGSPEYDAAKSLASLFARSGLPWSDDKGSDAYECLRIILPKRFSVYQIQKLIKVVRENQEKIE